MLAVHAGRDLGVYLFLAQTSNQFSFPHSGLWRLLLPPSAELLEQASPSNREMWELISFGRAYCPVRTENRQAQACFSWKRYCRKFTKYLFYCSEKVLWYKHSKEPPFRSTLHTHSGQLGVDSSLTNYVLPTTFFLPCFKYPGDPPILREAFLTIAVHTSVVLSGSNYPGCWSLGFPGTSSHLAI